MENSKSSADSFLLKIVRDITDYQFRKGVGERLFPDNCRVKVSGRTKRPKYVYFDGEILATIRYPDNLLALTMAGARRLLDVASNIALKVILKKNSVEKIKQGMGPLPREIVYFDERIKPGDEVLLLDEDGELIAVGRAVVSGSTFKGLERGIVVKIRKSVK
ncbi:MAG: hypothetical protein NZ918_00775 [Aigarchaeota archaeon]|nr:hypothetical protein [Aigarchaeota archaeon]MDW8021946.1 PUA domain-containing protein [Nitrososphaerota archaeon]